MIRSIEISNFRGIQHAQLDEAKRLNVLVGPNGTGKTAFLEALFLAGGNSPSIELKLRQWRGREGAFSGAPDQLYDAIWAEMFRDPQLGDAAIRVAGDDSDFRHLSISKTKPTRVIATTGEAEAQDAGVKFVWETSHGFEESTPRFSGGKFEMDAVAMTMRTHFLAARSNLPETESAQALSQLRIDGKSELFERAFLAEFPSLSDLSVEAPWGPPAIYARVPSGRKLPLTMISGGINQFAGMMLRLAANPKCVLLVDEIENGFFHDRYGSVWRALYKLAVDVDGQIFATTHSLECLKALAEAIPNHASDVRFARTRMRNNEVSIEQLSGETLFRALDLGEVR